MRLFTIHVDLDPLLSLMERIATALEHIAGPEPEPIPDLKPEEAVQYVNEEAMDRQAMIDEMGENARNLEEWLAEHPDEAPPSVF